MSNQFKSMPVMNNFFDAIGSRLLSWFCILTAIVIYASLFFDITRSEHS